MSAFALFICPITSELLLVLQHGTKWALPGGHKAKGESHRLALQRECIEEIRFNPATLAPADVLHVGRTWKNTAAVVHVFFHRPAPHPSKEITDARWFKQEALPRSLSKTARAALHALQQSKLCLCEG